MMNDEIKQRIRTHQEVIAELNVLSPEVEAYQLRISRFILNHRELVGLSYPGVEILMKEKEQDTRRKAIKMVGEELQARRDPNSSNYRLMYRKITESRVRKILLMCRSPSEKDKQVRDKKALIKLICPYCKKDIEGIPEKKSEVVSFRGTETEDKPITYLAARCGVSRSFLINELITLERKYGCSLKQPEHGT